MMKFFSAYVLMVTAVVAQTQRPFVDITPVPMEKLNPRLSEFLRIDTNSDNQLTFSEFILSDRPFIESQSRYFHELDLNNDGRITRNEFENYFKKHDEEERQQRIQTDQFFKNLGRPSNFPFKDFKGVVYAFRASKNNSSPPFNFGPRFGPVNPQLLQASEADKHSNNSESKNE
ncbi:unnamed protein product [Bursaphelenchus xylophilus]|uniref:(pine wood nematode) hypothetical protein n=1 Tax=Bursaphelenchus xylophilus TaxID=6326 RepID=A0A1I7S376_BURXY|nr:unnamed protein product [Bursaphelenchus xylophilus]CAG9116121.1 unnamed protein product [Bursaphelenchus xylophilus]